MRNIFSRLVGVLVALSFAVVPLSAFAQTVSVSIQNLTPGTTVSAGTTVTFNVIAAGFTNPSYSISDSLSGSTVRSSNINSNGVFNWVPQSADQGTHSITVSISDSAGHVASVAVQIVVASAYVTIQAPSPSSSVAAGTTVSFSTSVTGFNGPSFALSDNFNGTTLRSSNINSGGFVSWTPSSQDAGTHNITVLAFDSSGHSASANTVITVTSGSDVTIGTVSPGTTVQVGSWVVFNATANNINTPSFTVSDSFNGTSIQSGFISTTGDFSWKPVQNDIGTHTITVTAYDTQGHTGTKQVTITVVPQGSTTTTTPSTTSSTPSTSSSGWTAFTFTLYLVPGSQNNEVLMLQQLLQRKGYLTATPNGYFGSATTAALKQFQTAQGISATGTVGPQTRAILNQIEQSLAGGSTTSSGTTVSSGTSGLSTSAKLQLQTVLQLMQQIQTVIQNIIASS
jgi:hypothetical protein